MTTVPTTYPAAEMQQRQLARFLACKREQHSWDYCEHLDYVKHMKEFEREQRLLQRKSMVPLIALAALYSEYCLLNHQWATLKSDSKRVFTEGNIELPLGLLLRSTF